MTTPNPRGIRNNNPGNIRWGDEWKGLVAESDRTDKDFCQFTQPEFGIRAIAKIICNYSDKHGLRTVRQIINRWAPPNENNTEAYIQAVARKVGVGADAVIMVQNYLTMKTMVEAIITHENGVQPYSPQQIDRGLKLAGL